MNWIDKSRKIHGDKYDYSKAVYKNALSKVEIVCPEHGSFWQTPASHYSNRSGCPACAGRPNHDTESFVKRAREIHGDKYDYSHAEYINNKTPVKIICPEHGVFEQTPVAHINKERGCRRCTPGFYEKKSRNQFVKQANTIHSGKYDYSQTDYEGAFFKTSIVCREHGEFSMAAKEHLRGYGCPVCARLISKPEIELKEFLEKLNVKVTPRDRKLIYPLEIDLVLPDHNLAIEYCGLYWHGERSGKDRNYHIDKQNKVDQTGYRLITIFEDEWVEKPEVVKSVIKYKLGISERGSGARKLHIDYVDRLIALNFLHEHHLLGPCNGSIWVGAFENQNLVGLMVFGRPTRQTSSYEWELLRYTTDGRVFPGMAGKMFSFFIKNHTPDSIVSFADHRWFDGDFYENLGFVNDGEIPPDYSYTRNGQRYHKSSKRKAKLLSEDGGLDVNMTEREMAMYLGYDRVWDCGKTRYVWKKNNASP